jgi:hypothetical protein
LEPGTLLGKDDLFVLEPGIDALFPKNPCNRAANSGATAFDRSLPGSNQAGGSINGDLS